MKTSRKLKLYLLSLALFAAVFLGAAVLAEFLVRLSVPKQTTEARDHVEEASYMPARYKAHYAGVMWGVPFRTNRYGFRDEEDFEKTPPEGEYRIISLGDSIGFGVGVPASSHYTQVAERYLNERDPLSRFRICNAAGQGYSPSSYYVYLRSEGLELQPHMVITDIELCSVITNEALLRWERDPENPDVPVAIRGGRYVVGWDGNYLATYSVGPYFFEKTYVYTVLLRRFFSLMFRLSPTEPFASQEKNGCCYYNLGFDRYVLDEERLESGWKRTFDALEAIHRLLQERRIPFLVMIFPSQYIFQEEIGVWHTFAEGVLQRGVTTARQRGIPHMVMREAIGKAGGADLFFDFAHLTEEGNIAAGQALGQELAARVRQE